MHPTADTLLVINSKDSGRRVMPGVRPLEHSMLFINPMWDNEAERIGKQRCTRLGYALHTVSDLIGFVALLLLLGTIAYLGYRGMAGTFRASLLWLLPVPFGLAVIASILYRVSWVVAHRRGFRYDSESREASWPEDGQRRTYKYNDAA